MDLLHFGEKIIRFYNKSLKIKTWILFYFFVIMTYKCYVKG